LSQPIFDKVYLIYISNKYIYIFILELSDDTGGFLGRTLSQAMSWMRGSSSRLNQPIQTLPLQTCLTYLTLPCQFIVKDILESNQIPILTF